MKLIPVILLLLATSCANQSGYRNSEVAENKPVKQMEWEPNKNFWIGKNEEVLSLHPIFATMPVESRKTSSGIETRRYVQGGSIKSSEECKGNHCAGESNNNACNHVFYIKGSKITNYHRVGACVNYAENLQLRPLDKDGKYEASLSEKNLLQEVFKDKQAREIAQEKENMAANEEKACSTRADCLEGMTCKISEAGKPGICVHHGIFGRLFNQ